MIDRNRGFIRKSLVLLTAALIVAACLTPTLHPIHAQEEPTSIIDAAYRDLSQKMGVTIVRRGTTLRPTTYSWINEVYADSSLDCPAKGLVYTQGEVTGYQITIHYGGTTFDYRAKADGSLVFECSATNQAPGGQSPTSTNNTSGSTTGSSTGSITTTGASSSTSGGSFSAAPLLMQINGDTWSWSLANPTAQQLTTWGYNQPGIMSPDGKTIAYASSAQFAVDLIKAGQLTHSAVDPTNIWILETASNNKRRLVDQPTGTSMSGTYMIRSQPAWSPDSHSVAWTEVTVNNKQVSTFQLMTMAIDATTPSVIASFSPQVVNLSSYIPAPAQWGKQGIAVLLPTVTASANNQIIFAFDVKGGVLFKSEPLQGMSTLAWITDGTEELLAAVPTDSAARWKVVEASTGKISDMAGSPELYSLNTTTGLSVAPVYSAQGTVAEWVINGEPSANATLLHDLAPTFSLLNNVAISADGSRIAYLTGYNIVLIGPSGESTITSSQGLSGMVWGPTALRLRK